MKLNTLGNLLMYGSVGSLPLYAAAKRSKQRLESMYEPLNIRLRKVIPENTKISSEKKSELFSQFREKTAAGLINAADLSKFTLPIIGGTIAADAIGSIGGSAMGPTMDVMGYKLYKTMFPDMQGMVEYTRAPEKALQSAAQTFGTNIGASASEGLSNIIGGLMNKNTEIINATPRRKMILDQLRREDDLIKDMPLRKAMEAYHSMVGVAPTLSTDKNAVKSFLRTVAMTPDGGVDWNTLKGLADAEVSVSKAKGMGK